VALFAARVFEAMRPEFRVLDFGAGRQNTALGDLRGLCARVDGCDVDRAVLSNPHLTAASLVRDNVLPYPDASFDMILSSYVWEHIDEPDRAIAEMLRVLKPGGLICAITTNAWGYVGLAARAIPKPLHRAVLRSAQPGREDGTIFPASYRLNTRKAVAAQLARHGALEILYSSGTPSYSFDSNAVRFLFGIVHRLLPNRLQTTMCVFFRKAV
jgi:SAM-dependent methyltransferase